MKSTTSKSRTLITSTPESPEDDPQEEGWELTEEELERLDREMGETYRTGATPLLDSLLPGKDWHEESLLEVFHLEVERQLLRKDGARAEAHREEFMHHVERSFKRGHPEEQCAREWLLRVS